MLPLKIVLFSRIDPGTISILERDHDLRTIIRAGSAIESQAEINGRILEFIDANLAGTLSDVVKPVELDA